MCVCSFMCVRDPFCVPLYSQQQAWLLSHLTHALRSAQRLSESIWDLSDEALRDEAHLTSDNFIQTCLKVPLCSPKDSHGYMLRHWASGILGCLRAFFRAAQDWGPCTFWGLSKVGISLCHLPALYCCSSHLTLLGASVSSPVKVAPHYF